MTGVSLRSWLVLALPVTTLLLVVTLLMFPSDTSVRPLVQRVAPVENLRDTALPGGGTAQLSKCGVDDGPRPDPRGEGERGDDPALVLTAWDVRDPGPGNPGDPTFTVHLAVHAEGAPLLLEAPLAKGGVTLDLYGPHGEGRRASARGLTATAVDGGLEGKPLAAPPSGRFRVASGKVLHLDVAVPAGAICPGHSMLDAVQCSPEVTNDAADCPVVTVTLSDPAVRAHRAAEAEGNAADGTPPTAPESFSDRLVAVSLEPDVRGT
ncbi:hypothetical protein QRN89_30630 [Streptomyces chengbuensis]|uniref:hypothetical protein n=1 Tax=Streptomyces TaxID=1883 RepID=UPI0025B54BBD|nr:hypothetical protein [Streptomyces sp. HUAS CB01]WJY53780.1 hypothetical protein QRN89_30630 [Streptomyces sp. HUAS CB01]